MRAERDTAAVCLIWGSVYKPQCTPYLQRTLNYLGDFSHLYSVPPFSFQGTKRSADQSNMRVASTLLALTSAASGLVLPRHEPTSNSSTPSVAPAHYDGKCFYPVPDSSFNLDAYLGTWYQVAGTPFGPTAGTRCVAGDYSLNVRICWGESTSSSALPFSQLTNCSQANGTVRVVNTARVGTRHDEVVGTATAADAAYGAGGVFTVNFPGRSSPPKCPGPNYIVQRTFKPKERKGHREGSRR